MKKIYDAPVAEKVDFDYEENVVASSVIETKSATKCGGDSCKQDKPYCPPCKPKHFWFFWCWW